MNKYILPIIVFLSITYSCSDSNVSKIEVQQDKDGFRLLVDGENFMINGINWDYIPIGTNTLTADFWNQPEDIIMTGLDSEMKLLADMNVNTVRLYTGVPPQWIEYIYSNFGIYTMLNHSFGRYGVTIDDIYQPVTDYSNKKTQEILLNEVKELADTYKDTPGLLLYLLGNENNYGLFWQGAETEDFPDDDKKIEVIGDQRGKPMYRLMNEAAKLIKGSDKNHPVAICNGDDMFLNIIAKECPDIDIFGTNTYRGSSFTDIFDVVKKTLNKPIMFTEFGADAYDAINQKEDQLSQAFYLVENWKDIYSNAAGLGKAENSIGGFTFQFSDGWWKLGFDKRENDDIHDTEASWANGGYKNDFEEGKNNMNEEWFGICAKGPTDEKGLYKLYPRAAYYALKEVHKINPYAEGITLSSVENQFQKISLEKSLTEGRQATEELKKLYSRTMSLSPRPKNNTSMLSSTNLNSQIYNNSYYQRFQSF